MWFGWGRERSDGFSTGENFGGGYEVKVLTRKRKGRGPIEQMRNSRTQSFIYYTTTAKFICFVPRYIYMYYIRLSLSATTALSYVLPCCCYSVLRGTNLRLRYAGTQYNNMDSDRESESRPP